MKKAFTLALVGVLGLGAAAVAIPAALSNTTTPPARVDEAEEHEIIPNGVYGNQFEAVWNPKKNGFDLKITMPTQGYYRDEDYNSVYVDLPRIDKAVLSKQNGWGNPVTEIAVFENLKPGEVIEYTHVFSGEYSKEDGVYYEVKVYLGNQDSGDASGLYAGYPKTLAEDPKDGSYTTTEGKAPVTISFTAPAYYLGTEIPIDGTIDLIQLYTSEYNSSSWSYETTVWQELTNVEPGSKQQFVVTEGLDEAKTYSFRIKAIAFDGETEALNVDVLIGKDTPSSPKNVTVAENADGNIVVSWDPVTTGRQDGYFVPEEVTYKVTKALSSYGQAETLAEGLTECSYVFDTSTLTEPTEFYFKVSASTPQGNSSETAAPSIVAGPASPLPFVETFNNNGYSDKLWGFSCPGNQYMRAGINNSHVYMNDVEQKPVGGQGGMLQLSYYSSHAGLTSYYTSSKIDVAGVESLDLAFQLLRYPGTTGAVDAQVAFDGGEFTSVAQGDMTDGDVVEWVKHKGTIAVPAGAKTAVIRFAISAGDVPDYVCIDEVSLRDSNSAVTPYPASVSDLKAVYDFEADPQNVTVTFKAPTLTHHTLGEINDQPLEYITRIDLLRCIGYSEYTPVHSFDNPAPGDELKYIDTDLAVGGEFYYKVLVYVDENCDFGQFLDKPVKVGQTPTDVNDLKAVTTKGKAPVTLTFTTPVTDDEGGELRSIKSVKVRRKASSDYSSFSDTHNIKVLDEVETGNQYTVADETAEEGFYYNYQVVICGTGGDSFGRQVSVLVGDDQPTKPTNIVATVNDDKTVTVTWDAPTEGVNNGYIDFDNLTYIILLGSPASDYDATEIERNVKATTYTYTPEPGDERAVRFFVKAVNGTSEGYSDISNTVIVGDPSTLPYQEKFNTKINDWNLTFNHIWTTSAENSSDVFGCAEQAYMPGNIESAVPVDNDGGLVYVYYGTYSTAEMDQYLTSGNIDVEGHDMVVATFHYYEVPGYQTSLEFSVSFDGSDFYPFWDVDFSQIEGTDEDAAWKKVELPIATGMMNAKTIQIQLHSHKGAMACSAAFDNVTVFSLPAPVLEANGSELTWTVEPNEFAELTGFRLYKKNEDNQNELHSAHAANVTSHSPEAEGTYCVSALYGENLETLYSNEVELKLDGITSAVAGNVTVKALAGSIVVEGAEGLAVSIATVDGRVIYSAEGDATVSVVPGIYLVKVAGTAVKLNVR